MKSEVGETGRKSSGENLVRASDKYGVKRAHVYTFLGIAENLTESL
jgi:hypothetical protein